MESAFSLLAHLLITTLLFLARDFFMFYPKGPMYCRIYVDPSNHTHVEPVIFYPSRIYILWYGTAIPTTHFILSNSKKCAQNSKCN